MDVDKRCREITDQIVEASNAVAPRPSPMLTWAEFAAAAAATTAFYRTQREKIYALEEDLEALGD